MKPITIKDIAHELGISVSTVSRALQNHPDISERTKVLVQECAKRLNYKPNLMASNLRTSRNTTIGVVMPELNHHFFSSVLNGIEQSDTDYGGVYIAPTEMLLGLSENYEPQVSDDKHDITYYELGRWVELLMKANPNALESLFVPEDKIVGKVHPAIQLIIDNRDLFVTKEGWGGRLLRLQ